MSRDGGIGRRLAGLRRLLGRDVAREVDDELAFHLEMRVAELVEAGESPERARELALRRLGDLGGARERCVEIQARRRKRMARSEWWRGLKQDVVYAARALRKRPGFTAVAVATLALGTGANTAIFSVVDPLVVRALPYPEAERLVAVWPDRGALSRAEYVAVAERVPSLEAAEAYQPGEGFTLGFEGDAPSVRVEGALVTPGLFAFLGARPALGRGFLPEEGEPGGGDVVLLSHGLWRERFAGDTAMIGRPVLVDGVPRTVVGVMAAGFGFPSRRDRLWMPVVIDPANAGEAWGYSLLDAVGRLRPGATAGGAAAELRSLAGELRLENPLWTPAEGYGREATVVPLADHLSGDLRLPLLVLFAAVGVVLLIACVNVANLLLARSAGRARELAVRAALGASRGRLIRQLLTESVLLALLGAAGGLLLARWGLAALVGGLPADTPRLDEVALDGRVLAFTILVAAGAGVLFGLLPALRGSRSDLRGTLGHGVAGVGGRQRRLAGALVAGEIALAVLLVTSAGLLIRSFDRLTDVDPGFRTERVLTARLTPPPAGFEQATRRRQVHRAILDRVAALPGVRAAALTSQLPFDRDPVGSALMIRGVTPDPNDLPTFDVRAVTPDFFETLGVPLVRGRTFHPGDDAGGPLVALIDQTAARTFFPDRDPLGATVGFPWFDEWMTVVGVVGTVKNRELGETPRPALYRPFAQAPRAAMKLVARVEGDPSRHGAALPGLVAAVEPAVAVSDVQPMDAWIDDSLARPRFATSLLLVFAALALVLGAVGIYGVLSYATSQRQREFGVRMALGAGAASVARLTLRHAAVLAAAGLAAGLAAAWAATRLLASLLYDTSATDPLTFALVPLLLGAVALVAGWLPARRAARVDPVVVLKGE